MTRSSLSSTIETITDELRGCIIAAQKSKQAIRIKYISQLDKITYKTIYSYNILPTIIKRRSDKDEVFYLEGKNVADNSKRTFRSDRILKIAVLKRKY